MKALSDNIELLFLALEEGKRKPEIAKIAVTIPQMAVARLGVLKINEKEFEVFIDIFAKSIEKNNKRK